MNWKTPREIELEARLDEIDAARFLVNSGVSLSAIATGLAERTKKWKEELDKLRSR